MLINKQHSLSIDDFGFCLTSSVSTLLLSLAPRRQTLDCTNCTVNGTNREGNKCVRCVIVCV